MTDRSLIIIDELGRSTSMEEGTAIAMEICDTLARSKAFTFVTTHFIMLTKLAELFINIKVWQLETIPIGNTHNPKALKLNFKFSLVPGVTTVRGYGIYMVRGIWPDDVMKHVDQLQESYFKKPNNPNFPSIDKRVRLRYELDCKLNKLKLRKRFTLAQLNTLINEYNSQMQNLGSAEDYAYSQNIINQFQDVSNDGLVVLEHSIFDASQSQLNSLASQENSEIHHEQVNLNNQGMYPRMSGLFTQDISSQSINIDNNNFFNLPLNNAPQIIFNYDSSQSSGNVTQRVLSQERRKELPGYISNFNDDLSELSASALSQKLEEILRQEEMDKLNFQVPAPPPRPSVPSESPFISTFSRALEDDSRKTSTPMISTIQHDAKGFGDSSNLSSISKRYAGDVTHIRTDRLSFSFPRHQEDDIDIESVVEDLESFAEEIENNDENDKDAAINNDDLSQLSSNEISQRYEAILRQEEMDKRIFQVPPPPQIEIQVSESSFNDLSQLSSNDISQQYKAILRQEEMDKRIFQVPPPPQREIQVLESFDDLSQLSSNAISQQYEAILRQEEMEKRISQGPPPPQREIQIPESSFNSSFSLPLEENSKKTSTPTLGRLHLQQVLTSFGNSSGNRNSGDISILRNQKDDDIDIASMVEDLEPFIEEIENNNENEDEGDTINNDDVSQLSCSLLSQRYKAIEWQEETDKRIFQAPPPPQQDIQVPESPFTSTFSRPLQEDSRKTSTPTLGRLQQDFGNSFGNRNSGDVTHVTTKRSFSIMRNQKDDDIDIASMVEDLESFIEEIENNNEHDNEDAIDNYNILKPSPSASSSGALSQKFEDIMRQDEMDEHFSQRVPQVPESPFTSTFSRPLQEGSRRTSTPICDRIIQPGAKNFGNSSTISKGSDRMSFSLTRYQEENADIVSKAGDFETIVDEIDINDEKGPGREPRVESPVTSTSSRPRYFGNSSNLSTISKKFTGNVTSDKICFSLPRHPENDMVEDMESLIYIENKNQNATYIGSMVSRKELPTQESKQQVHRCF